jgi:alpha-L-fucosidase 2
MLMQSAHGYINVLPALPTVWNKQGDVKGMKAMGNFTVDFNWNDGKCQQIKIVSHAGAALKVRCKRGAMEIANALITVNGQEVKNEVDENGIATIPCAKDDVVVINFMEETTGINGVATQNGETNKAMYDLSGRRIATATAGQVYIQDGVKKLSK